MMKRFPVLILFSWISLPFFGQDSLRYRVTSFHVSAAQFIILSPQQQPVNGFAPSAALSLKSARTDSLYRPFKKFNFMITTGIASSRFMLIDEIFFKNFLDKSPMLIFSRRFWGGFGINYRSVLSKKLILDIDVAPCVQMIVDKSIETRTDTSSWESKGFEDIYEGLHLYTNIKLEYNTKSNFALYITLAGSVPLLNRFVDNGDERYHNTFRGQLFLGLGLTHFYRSKHKVEKDEKPRNNFN
ncbi:MAG TPA: hypothetical protein VNY73_03550 [Bacteroidia bacterium]|jgi:hypothetical protein|nr:hypothetical protein [Bacteroidia bacterium]